MVDLHKQFGSHLYDYAGSVHLKKEATARARMFRKRGFNARIIEIPNKYAIYIKLGGRR